MKDSQAIAEALIELGHDVRSLSSAVLPGNAVPSDDAAGAHVSSLTEAVMGVTAGLMAIAESIARLADAVVEAKYKE